MKHDDVRLIFIFRYCGWTLWSIFLKFFFFVELLGVYGKFKYFFNIKNCFLISWLQQLLKVLKVVQKCTKRVNKRFVCTHSTSMWHMLLWSASKSSEITIWDGTVRTALYLRPGHVWIMKNMHGLWHRRTSNNNKTH